MPSEIEKFQQDLLESVKQMRRGEAVRTTRQWIMVQAHIIPVVAVAAVFWARGL